MTDEPIDDVRAIAEAVVDLLTERGLLAAPRSEQRVLNATQVAALLQRDRQWVYRHAEQLGAFRFGEGPRARLGFDAQRVEAWMREQQPPARADAPRRGRRAGKPQAPLIPYRPARRHA